VFLNHNRWHRFFLFILTFSFITTVFHHSVFGQSGKNFLWKIRSEANTVYLLGSVHVMKKHVYPLNKKIEESFDLSDIVVVEADIGDMGQIDIQKVVSTAFYPENDTLENHISKDTYELVKKECADAGMPLLIVNKQKPWFLALTITSLKLMQMGYDPSDGIDAYFLRKASGKKGVQELESVDFQMKLLSGFSDKEQEALLVFTLRDLKLLDKELDKLIRAWENGDTKTMESITIENAAKDKDMHSIYEKIIFDRNRNMVSKIEDFLKTKKTYFVIVGAGHLIGNQGIITLLRQKGYPVEQL
jgi:uncharacterized protein